MNLVVDIGNTRIKAVVFEHNQLIQKALFSSYHDLLNSDLLQFPINNSIIASVTDEHLKLLPLLQKKFPTQLFSANTSIPLKNLYKTPQTLGADRIAASVGAFSLYPSQNVLSIDAGTCIKYNFVNASNEYLGGAISPGVNMRLQAMHQFSHALPAIDLDNNYSKLIGLTTNESLSSGAITGSAAEIDGMITYYSNIYPNLIVLITGGDADYLVKLLKNRFFANQNLVSIGLNTILNHSLGK